MPDPVLPPLPSLGADGFAPPGRQQWQPPVARQLLDQNGVPEDVLLGVACETVTQEDHRRCLAAAVPWNWLWEIVFTLYMIVMVTVVINWRRGIGAYVLGGGFAALVIFCTLGMLIRYVFWRSAVTTTAKKRAEEAVATATMLLANRDGLYHVTPCAVTALPWVMLNVLRETRGDVLIQNDKGKKLDGWLYVPRRAFASEADARLFASTLRNLAKAKGDSAALSAEARVTFPPP